MNPSDLYLSLAAVYIAVWAALLFVICRLAARWERQFVVSNWSRLVRAVHKPTARNVVDGLGAVSAITWSVGAALFFAGAVLFVAPLFMWIGALEVAVHLVHIHPR